MYADGTHNKQTMDGAQKKVQQQQQRQRLRAWGVGLFAVVSLVLLCLAVWRALQVRVPPTCVDPRALVPSALRVRVGRKALSIQLHPRAGRATATLAAIDDAAAAQRWSISVMQDARSGVRLFQLMCAPTSGAQPYRIVTPCAQRDIDFTCRGDGATCPVVLTNREQLYAAFTPCAADDDITAHSPWAWFKLAQRTGCGFVLQDANVNSGGRYYVGQAAGGSGGNSLVWVTDAAAALPLAFVAFSN